MLGWLVFWMARVVGTRGHNLKLSVPICRSEMGRRIFGSQPRVVRVWNSLPSSEVEASSVESYKNWIYFWVMSCLVITENSSWFWSFGASPRKD